MAIVTASKRWSTYLIPVIGLLMSAEAAFAQNGLAISSDQVTISTTSGFNSGAKNLATTPGVIPATDNIPTGAISSDLTFSFTYTPASGKSPQDGTYNYVAGMYLDQDGSQRRLEMTISNISITIGSGGTTLTGNVASGNNTIVSGRSSDGSVQAQITLSNNTLNFSGSTMSVRLGSQVTEIQGSSEQILKDLTNTFSTAASYEYGVYLKQTGGPEGLTIGLANGTTVFGCAPSDPLILNGQSTSFQGAYALKGRMGIGQAAGGSVTALATGTSNCTTTPALSTGTTTTTGGDTTTTTEDTTVTSCPTGQVLIDGACFSSTASPAETVTSVSSAVTVTESFVVTESTTVEQVEELTTAVLNTVNTVLSSIPADTGTNTGTIVIDKAAVDNAIRAVSALLTVNNQAAAQGKQISNAAVVGALRQQRSLVRALTRSSEPLTSNEKASVSTNLKNTLRALNSLNLLARGSSVSTALLTRRARTTDSADGMMIAAALTGGSADLVATLDAIDEVGEIVSAAIQAEIDIDSEFVTNMQELVDSSVAVILDDVGAVVDPTDSALQAEYQDAATTRALLMAEPQMLDSLLEVVGISLSSETGVDTVSLNSSLRNAGLRTAPAQALAANVAGVATNPGGITLQLFNGDLTAQQSIQNALGSGVSGSYNTANGTLELTTNGDGFPVYVQSVYIVSESFPEGVFNLPDGRLVTISDGIASVHAPALVDIVAFAGALADARATMTINDDGALVIDGSGFTFIGSPGFNVGTVSGASGDVTVQAPSAAPTGDGYAYTLDFGGGVTQTILPHLQQSEFYDVLSSQGFTVTTDRSTGAISVTTPDGAEFRFKPDFFLATPNQEDLNFRLANGGLLAPAFRPVDANGDGVTDYRVMLGAVVQILYGMP